jgi:hypothetical protein
MLGFSAGLVAPTAFGIILDLAGGAQSGQAWSASFVALALPNLIAIAVLRYLAAPDGAPRAVARFAQGLTRDLPVSDRERRA